MAVHRSSDPGHWIVTFPWVGAERALTLTDAALALAERDVSPSRHAHLTGAQERQVARWAERIAAARATPPEWIRDRDRTVPIVSVSGTNGKSTVTRLITHILLRAGRRVGTTTSDGVLVDERMVDPGDWTGPGGAHQILARRDIEVAVLETARGGIVLRGVGYESNDASVLTNVSSDHLDLQGIHTLPELAEVKSTICRITRADGWVVLNADDPLVAAVARRVRAKVALFTLDGDASAGRATPPRARRPRLPGARRRAGRGRWRRRDRDRRRRRRADHDRRPGPPQRRQRPRRGRRRARARGDDRRRCATGCRTSRPTPNARRAGSTCIRLGSRVVIVDFAHNEAGMAAVLDVAQGIAGGRGRSGGADHRDHRDRRRPARRHAPGHRPDRRRARPAGRDQADAQVPARPDRRVGRRRADGRDRGRRWRRGRGADLHDRDRRRSRPSSTVRPEPARAADDRTRRGSSS